ncbi:glycosyltransferase family 4 protein [Flavobacterium zhairuonense]|uniref:glycosyltransferase n=1 Tax=Flavobacterium zhairuonense TaxID=2493631 RepID=UPI00104D6B28|nr:glycosyltransferase [Flavobacterium zhairuonense]KAF2515519.1 glycosyltransferase family 4 protein [Flavobacterium zhairuonense]
MGIFKNIKRFCKRKEVIKSQDDQSIPNYDTYNSSNKTIVFFSIYMLTPEHDSGSNRLKEIILFFKKKGYNCVICSKNTFRMNNYVSYFSDLGVIVYVENNQFNTYFDFIKTIPKVDFVWFFGARSLGCNLSKVSQILPNAISIFDMIDIHFLRYKRGINIDPKRISLRKNYMKFLYIETKLARNVDFIVTISDIEKEIMSKYVEPHKLITISNIHYKKINKEEALPFEKRKDILFIGSQHEPNIDAVNYLYHEIMPIVWRYDNSIKVNIIGNVNEKIKNIDDSRFIFHGYISDVKPLFTKNKLMVAPLRYGAGIKGKIGQAFEYYLPVVTSSIGAEGMNLVNEKNALIYDAEKEFASAIIDLYFDKATWLELQQNSEESLEPYSIKALESVFITFDSL